MNRNTQKEPELESKQIYLQLQCLPGGKVNFLLFLLLQYVYLSVHCFRYGILILFGQQVVQFADFVGEVVSYIIL